MVNFLRSLHIFSLTLTLLIISACHPTPPEDIQTVIQEIVQNKSDQDSIVTISIADRIKHGETLSAILTRNGIYPQQIPAIVSSFQKVFDVRKIQAHQPYTIEKDSLGNFIKFSYHASIDETYMIIKEAFDQFASKIERMPLEKKICRIKGVVKSTMYDAILAEGESPELLIAFTDIFQWDVDFFIDPRAGDQFKIIYEAFYIPKDVNSSKSEQERFVRYGKILAAEYTLQGEKLTAIFFQDEQKAGGYYALDGESFQKTFLKSPLNYRRISSYFSLARRHPILKIVRPHYGIDFSAPTGTPVSAAADGTIIKKGYMNDIGNYIKIRHKNPRFETLYGHLSRFAEGMEVGKRVDQKEVIGYVGKTGLATGPHLHYTFYENGKPINPLKIKNTAGDPIEEENMHQFQAAKDDMLAEFEKLDAIPFPLVENLSQYIHYNRYLFSNR